MFKEIFMYLEARSLDSRINTEEEEEEEEENFIAAFTIHCYEK